MKWKEIIKMSKLKNEKFTSAYPASEATPSWIRAPPESFNPTTGAPIRYINKKIRHFVIIQLSLGCNIYSYLSDMNSKHIYLSIYYLNTRR
jgi:hypothetical protein